LRIRFDRGHLLATFAFYLVIIAVPLVVLVFQGMTSLDKQRRQQEDNLEAKLRGRVTTVIRDLKEEWRLLIEREKTRPTEGYQPIIIPDPDIYEQTSLGERRAPVYDETIDHLAKIDLENLGAEVSGALPSLGESLHDSLIGYWQYDCSTEDWTTPYDPVPDLFDDQAVVRDYREFLARDLEPALLNQIMRVGERNTVPTDILRYLKAKKISTAEAEAPREIGGPRELIYDFHFFDFFRDNKLFVACFRPVLQTYDAGAVVPDSLLLQGFVFSGAVLQSEIQAHLEPLQEEFGNLVVQTGVTGFDSNEPLFQPFQQISILWEITSVEMSGLEAERQRFWAVIALLILSLTVTLVHLGSLVKAQMDLARKKNNFVSAVTHELKAPLTSIIMYAEMLEEGWARGKEQTYYHYIHWESERLTRLIKNILDYSGLERGTFKLSPVCVLLHEVVTEALEPLRVWAGSSGLEIALVIEAEPEVLVDRDSLSQIIYNLYDNTIKYALSVENPTLTLRIGESEGYGRLIIHDNGPGIAKEDQRRVFERFFRVENEMTREQTGTGLGLALVKELVEGNKGRVALYNPPGGGFGIAISLPKPDVTAMST